MPKKKYIELDAALAALGEEPYKWVDYSEAQTQEHNDWECHYNAISAIPAADVVEVVRCKDCIYWRGENDLSEDLREKNDEWLAEWLNQMETEARYYGPKGKAAWLAWLQEKVE